MPDPEKPLHFQDAAEMACRIRTGALTAMDLCETLLGRIEQLQPSLNAFVTLCSDDVLERARAVDRARADGQLLGPLARVPFSVKDSIDTAGVQTQRGSRFFAGRIPDQDATAVSRLRRTGAILLGKTNLPEFSRWWETDNVLSGGTNNPWDLERSPDGSSGSEAAAIATGLSPPGIGTDVGIAVRGLAHFTEIAAMKPTHNRIPLTGSYSPGPNRMWHIGPMARSLRDVELAYNSMQGPDGKDGFAIASKADIERGPRTRARVPRIGWIVDGAFGPIDSDVASAVRSAAELLADLGCVVSETRLPILEEIDRAVASAPFFAETLLFLKPLVAGREDELSSIARRRLARPGSSFEEDVEAERTVERLRSAFAGFFGDYDILCPTVPFTAPRPDMPAYQVARASRPIR